MGYLEMTNLNEITIFDEVVNCGILEEDSIVNFGAGHADGMFLETLRDYNGSLGQKTTVAIDINSKKIKMLSKKFKGEDLLIEEISIQDFIENSASTYDWTVITGVFDNFLYGERQYDFVTTIVNSAIKNCNKGLIFTIKETITDDFKYSMVYFLLYFSNNYQRLTVKKFNDGNYIFCIFK